MEQGDAVKLIPIDVDSGPLEKTKFLVGLMVSITKGPEEGLAVLGAAAQILTNLTQEQQPESMSEIMSVVEELREAIVDTALAEGRASLEKKAAEARAMAH